MGRNGKRKRELAQNDGVVDMSGDLGDLDDADGVAAVAAATAPAVQYSAPSANGVAEPQGML